MKNNKLLLGSALMAGTILSFAHFYLDNTFQSEAEINNETGIHRCIPTGRLPMLWD